MATYGLEFSEIYARVQDYANIKNIVDSDTKAKAAVNDALNKLATLRRWTALRRKGTLTPTADTQTISISSLTGFNYPVRVYYNLDGLDTDIEIVSESQWRDEVDSQNSGTPSICIFSAMDGTEKLYLSPKPSSAFISLYTSIYVDYDKKPTKLSGATDVPEIPGTNNQLALVYYAVAELCAQQGDINGVSMWEQKALKELNAYFKSDINFKGKGARGKPVYGILDSVYITIEKKDYND